LVAVTVHVPELVEDSAYGADALTTHPVAVPSAATNVTAPVPEPPLVVSGSGVAKVPAVDVTISGVCCCGTEMVTVVGAEDAAKNVRSAPLAAVTVQVPALVTDKLYGIDALTVHPLAVPSTATNVTAPVPDPPEVVNGSGVPTTPPVEVSVRGAWD
jgi:hypothetical protein